VESVKRYVYPFTEVEPLDPHGLAADQADRLGRVIQRAGEVWVIGADIAAAAATRPSSPL
jgi:hypothetical protein